MLINGTGRLPRLQSELSILVNRLIDCKRGLPGPTSCLLMWMHFLISKKYPLYNGHLTKSVHSQKHTHNLCSISDNSKTTKPSSKSLIEVSTASYLLKWPQDLDDDDNWLFAQNEFYQASMVPHEFPNAGHIRTCVNFLELEFWNHRGFAEWVHHLTFFDSDASSCLHIVSGVANSSMFS